MGSKLLVALNLVELDNQNIALISFHKNKSAKAVIEDKSNIYKMYKLKVEYKINETDESDENEYGLIIYLYKNIKGIDKHIITLIVDFL